MKKQYRRDAQDSNQNDSWTQLDNGDIARNVIPLNEKGNSDFLVELSAVFRVLLQSLVDPGYLDKATNSLRTNITSGTVTTVSTVTSVTGITNFGSFPADTYERILSENTWANACRSLIT